MPLGPCRWLLSGCKRTAESPRSKQSPSRQRWTCEQSNKKNCQQKFFAKTARLWNCAWSAEMRKDVSFVNNFVLIFPPPCAKSWHLDVLHQFLGNFTQILFIFTLTLGVLRWFYAYLIDIRCIALILRVFIDLFGANFLVAKFALVLICTLLSCLATA